MGVGTGPWPLGLPELDVPVCERVPLEPAVSRTSPCPVACTDGFGPLPIIGAAAKAAPDSISDAMAAAIIVFMIFPFITWPRAIHGAEQAPMAPCRARAFDATPAPSMNGL